VNFLKIKLLIIAVIMLAASSAFASLSYDVSVNTSSLAGQSGYLYLQYNTWNGVASTATVSNFTMDGALGAQDTKDVIDGSAVTGTLPGNVVFANTNGINDYEHAITLGNSINFSLLFSSPAPGGQAGGNSTFSIGLFADGPCGTPLLNTTGVSGSVPGTLLMVNLFNDGSTSAQSLDSSTTATPTPIPAAAWLLGSGLMGLVGMRKRTQI
jgi:hypothetical protein